MPPVGQVFSDEQIAAVLTYIRREWGQEGTPVDVATVEKVRAMTADRSGRGPTANCARSSTPLAPLRVP